MFMRLTCYSYPVDQASMKTTFSVGGGRVHFNNDRHQTVSGGSGVVCCAPRAFPGYDNNVLSPVYSPFADYFRSSYFGEPGPVDTAGWTEVVIPGEFDILQNFISGRSVVEVNASVNCSPGAVSNGIRSNGANGRFTWGGTCGYPDQSDMNGSIILITS